MKIFFGLVCFLSIAHVKAAGFSDCLRSVELPANSPIQFDDAGEVKFPAVDSQNAVYEMVGFKKTRYTDDNPMHPYADFKGSEYGYAADGTAKEFDVRYKIVATYNPRRIPDKLDIPKTLSIKKNDDTTQYRFRSRGENCRIESISKNNYTLYSDSTCESVAEYNKKPGKKSLSEIKTQFAPVDEKPFAIETEDRGKYSYKAIDEASLTEDDVKKFVAQCKAKIFEKPVQTNRRRPGQSSGDSRPVRTGR